MMCLVIATQINSYIHSVEQGNVAFVYATELLNEFVTNSVVTQSSRK